MEFHALSHRSEQRSDKILSRNQLVMLEVVQTLLVFDGVFCKKLCWGQAIASYSCRTLSKLDSLL
jgi:hypothetical protein